MKKIKIYFRFSRQGFWTREDFRHFLNLLFSNKGRPYLILNDKIDEYFHETDFNRDNKIDFDEFIQAWKTTIKCVNIFQLLFVHYYLFIYFYGLNRR
jgi:hypothetical protein